MPNVNPDLDFDVPDDDDHNPMPNGNPKVYHFYSFSDRFRNDQTVPAGSSQQPPPGDSGAGGPVLLYDTLQPSSSSSLHTFVNPILTVLDRYRDPRNDPPDTPVPAPTPPY